MTGANYHLEYKGVEMLVDCGLNQGTKYAEDLNYEPFGYDPSKIKYVFITHSHIDHIGRLPRLYRLGFRGVVYASSATRDLIAVALPDNMKHINREAEESGREPLFEEDDLNGFLSLVQSVEYDEAFNLDENLKVTFHDAGHILGSTIVEINFDGADERQKLFFTGDLGNPPTPLLKITEEVKEADYIVIESAYGDRIHEPPEERKEKLARVMKETIGRGGVLMIPSFALERTQDLLFELHEMKKMGEVPDIPVFVDSPLAIRMTEVYKRHMRVKNDHTSEFNKTITDLIQKDGDIFDFPGLKLTSAVEESKAINDIPAPKIIIAGSGMSQGGRILHHELRYLSDPKNTILFVGYQVDGSLGRRIQRGEKQVRIFGQTVDVRCHVETITGYSAHADQADLLAWVKQAARGGRLKEVFVVQGEENAAKTLANLIRDRLSIPARAPKPGEQFEV